MKSERCVQLDGRSYTPFIYKVQVNVCYHENHGNEDQKDLQ
jgi:hypothetical protein